MDIFLAGIAVLCCIGLVICGFMIWRIDWVYERRMEMLDLKKYHRLPSFDYIVNKFWIWDIEKFLDIKD